MHKDEINIFIDTIHSIADNYNRAPLGRQTLSVWFGALKDHPLEVVQKAIADHVTDPLEGKFFPTIAHIIAKIESCAYQEAEKAARERSLTAWRDDVLIDGSDVTPMPESVKTALSGLLNNVKV